MQFKNWSRTRSTIATFGLAVILAAVPTSAMAQTPGSKPSAVTFPVEQDHFFVSEGVKLHGKFFAPAMSGKFPAIVYVTGGGNYSLMADAYARNTIKAFTDAGIAVFMFDKRGQGKSEGSYPTDETARRTADTIAAFDTMAKLPQVDPERLGVWALSQAGWFVPPVMTARPNADFLILLSPAGERHLEFWQTVTRYQLVRAGLKADEARDGAALWLSLVRYLGTANGFEATKAALAAAQEKPWFAAARGVGNWADLPTLAADLKAPDALRADWAAKPDQYDWMRTPAHDRDYSADYAAIMQPVLLIYGGADTLIDPAKSAKIFAEAWKGRRDKTIVTFSDTGHGIQRRGMAEEPIREYLDMATMFAKRHFKAGAKP